MDISKYCENPVSEYHLRGVIMHIGTATSGHYISYVKQMKYNYWLCFDDINVTEISEQDVLRRASGYSYGSTGYILYHENSHNLNVPKPACPDNFLKEINDNNREIKRKKIFLSKGYFELMNALIKFVSFDYFTISIKYSIDSLPFSIFVSESKPFYEIIYQKLFHSSLFYKNKFINYILSYNYLKKCLLDCP